CSYRSCARGRHHRHQTPPPAVHVFLLEGMCAILSLSGGQCPRRLRRRRVRNTEIGPMKQLRDQVATHYTTVAVILHWLIAFGWFLDSVPRGTPARGFYVNLHKSTGLTLAVLIVARVAWRLAHRPPPLPALMRPWERDAAQWSHAALYACMIGMPLSGYIASNFSKYGVKLFNVLTLPPWGVDDAQTYSIFNT